MCISVLLSGDKLQENGVHGAERVEKHDGMPGGSCSVKCLGCSHEVSTFWATAVCDIAEHVD